MKHLLLAASIFFVPATAFAQIAVYDASNATVQAVIKSEAVQQGKAIAEQVKTMKDQYNTMVDTYNASVDTVEEWTEFYERVQEYKLNAKDMYKAMGNLNDYLAEGDYYDKDKSQYENIGSSIDVSYPSYEDGVAAIQSGRVDANRRLQEELRSSLIASKQALANLEEDNEDMLKLAEEHERATTLAEKETVANKIALKNLEILQSMKVMMAHNTMVNSRAQYVGANALPEKNQYLMNKQIMDTGYKRWELDREEENYAKRFNR